MLFFLLACFGPACLISCVATAAMRRIAPRIGLIDQPAARKVHVTPTPLGGGVGIWLGVVLTVVVSQLAARFILNAGEIPEWIPARLHPHLGGVLMRSSTLWLILGAGTILFVMGLIDDRYGLPWQPRLAIQFGVACLLVLGGGIRASLFSPLPWLGDVVSILWLMVLINAYNFLDNMDALSSGIGAIAAFNFAVVMLTGTSEPRWLVAGLLLILCGSLVGFLFHNRPPAKIFMGDSGSQFLGMLIGTLTLLGTYYDETRSSTHVVLAPLCILAIPLYDFCSVILIRLTQGRSPFHADKSHFSHRLVELGLSKPKAVLTIHLATLTTGLGGILLYRVSDWTSAALIFALVLSVLAIIAILERAGLNRERNKRSSSTGGT